MASGGLTSELWVDCDSADPLILIFYVLWTFWINFWFLRFFLKYYLCSLLRFLAILRFAMEVSETLTLLLAQCTCPKYSSFLLCSREQDTHMATKKKKSEVPIIVSNHTFPSWIVFHASEGFLLSYLTITKMPDI